MLVRILTAANFTVSRLGQPHTRLKSPCTLESVKNLVDRIFQAAESHAAKRALDRHAGAFSPTRKGAAMLVYLAPCLADDAVLARILRDDSTQAVAAASMSAFRAIIDEEQAKYFNDLKNTPMYMKLVPVRYESAMLRPVSNNLTSLATHLCVRLRTTEDIVGD